MGDIALVEEAFNRLKSIKHNEGEVPALAIAISVSGLFVMNSDGIAIRSTMENDVTVHYAALVSRFVEKARAAVKQLNPDDELQFTASDHRNTKSSSPQSSTRDAIFI